MKLVSTIGLVLLALLAPVVSTGHEVFYLRSGFSLEAVSHVRESTGGSDVFTITTATGTIELPAAEISKIEVVPDPPSLQGSVAAGPIAPDELLRSAANAQGLPSEFVSSVAKVESGMQLAAISPKGALGLMQLMPETAANLGVSPSDPAENALGGARYLRQLLIRYHNNAALALAAYNAGPAAVSKYGGVPPYAETRNYIVRVLREYAKQQTNAKTASSRVRSNSSSAKD